MNKKTMRTAAVTVIAAALLTTTLLSGIMAEYSSQFTSSPTELVAAKWDIDVTGDGKTTAVSNEQKTISLSSSVDRQTTEVLVYEQNFDGNKGSSATPSSLGWTPPANIDGAGGAWVPRENNNHIEQNITTFVEDNETKSGVAAKFDAFNDNEWALYTIADKDDMQDADAYSISFRLKMTKEKITTGSANLFSIVFDGDRSADAMMAKTIKDANGNNTETKYYSRNYLRFNIRGTTSGGWPSPDGKNNTTRIPTDIGYNLCQTIDGQNLKYHFMDKDGSTNDRHRVIGEGLGNWVTYRLEVDNINETVSIYINDTLDYVFKNGEAAHGFEGLWASENVTMNATSGPIMLWTQYGVNYLDYVKVVKSVSRPSTTVYEEDFEDGIAGDTGTANNLLGWETVSGKNNIGITYAAENGGTAVKFDGSTEQRNVFVPQVDMIGVRKYSVSMDVKVPQVVNASGATVLDIFFNGKNAIGAKTDYMRLDIRPCVRSSDSDAGPTSKNNATDVGITVLDYDAGGTDDLPLIMPADMPIGSNYYYGSLNSSIQELNGNGGIDKWINVRMEVDNDKKTVYVYVDSRLILKHNTADNSINEGPLMFWSQFGSSYIDNIKVETYAQIVEITEIAEDSIAPGLGGKLAEVNINNKSGVSADFELVVKLQNANSGVLPQNFMVENGASDMGIKTSIVREGDLFTVTYQGRLRFGDTGNTVKCVIDWKWPYGAVGDNAQDTADGTAATSASDINVWIESLTVTQIKPGLKAS